MLIPAQILDDLAVTGANLIIDANQTEPDRLTHIVKLWDSRSGAITIRNAGSLSPQALVGIARTLEGRVTFEE